MPIGDIFDAKELAEAYQPLLLCEFTFKSGRVLRVSTHPLSALYNGTPTAGSYEYGGNPWLPRVLNQDIGATQAMSDLGVELVPQVTVILADPDKTLYVAWEAAEGFKGATLKLYSVMWDAGDTSTGSFSSNSPAPIKFIGTCSSPFFDEKTMSITATSLLNMTQIQMPPIRIQQRCSWSFPTNASDRAAGKDDPSSTFYECGYSYGLSGGVGNPQTGTAAFTSCTYDVDACNARLGNVASSIPIIQDTFGHRTGRFGGFRFIPQQSSGLQRSYLTGKWEEIINSSNEAKYGDFVPMCYGTTWVEPLVMGTWTDGNYSNFEVMLGYGQMARIKKVVVNGEEVAQLFDDPGKPGGHIPSDSVTSTFKNGWWGTINTGQRNGYPNTNAGWGGKGDPYGSVAAIYVSVLRAVAPEGSLPRIQVLLEGTAVRQYTTTTDFTSAYSSNPAWILLDLLIWSTWRYEDIDIQSFIDAAALCDQQTYFDRMDGTYANIYLESGAAIHKRYEVGFSVRQRSSIGELIRGLRNSMKSLLFFDYVTGKLTLSIKQTLGSQQRDTLVGSNFNDPIPSITSDGVDQDGYAAYLFNSTNIIKSEDGRSTLQISQKTNQDAPNKVTVSFQNRENSFSQDTATIVDTEDVSRLGQEVYGSLPLLGAQTFDHVRRIVNTWFAESYRGNDRLDYEGSAIGDTGGTLYFELETSIKALHLTVGRLCLITDEQHGIENQLVRVMKIQPNTNFETAKISMAWHNDNWYQDTFGQVSQPKYGRHRTLVDRKPYAWRADYEAPVDGDELYDPTDHSFGIQQQYEMAADGSSIAKLLITGKVPVNTFPDTPARPKLELVGQGTTIGGYAAGSTYYVGLASRTSQGTATFISALSKPLAIKLDDSSNALSMVVQNWPDNPSGYFAFVGEDPFSMTFQASSTSTPTTVELKNEYQSASWGAPDEAFSNFRWRVRRLQHAGVWGSGITSVTTASITLPVFPDWGFTTDEWAGRMVSVLGIQPVAGSASVSVPIANFLVSGNTADTISLATGNPLTCVGGGPLLPGDVIVMRFKPTFGEDSIGRYFEDDKAINRLNPVLGDFVITDASNATPIVITITVPDGDPFPFENGDTVVVRSVLGNLAANGGFIANSVDSVAGTFALVAFTGGGDTTGSGDYTSGGVVCQQLIGFDTDEEVGRIAFIISGTGRGTSAKIKANDDTRCYIDGDWPIAPDSSSQIIIMDAVPQLDLPSQHLVNYTPELVSTFTLDLKNYERQSLFVQASTQSTDGSLSPSTLDAFREMFLFGDPGADAADLTALEDTVADLSSHVSGLSSSIALSGLVTDLTNDGVIAEGVASMTSGSHTLTLSSHSFSASDVGKPISVSGAGASGVSLFSTITAYTNDQHVTLADAASTSVTLQTAMWGTDNSLALALAVTIVDGTGRLFLPAGTYATTDTFALTSDVGTFLIDGCGYDSSIVCFLDGTKNGIDGLGGSGSGLRNCAFANIYLRGSGNGGVVSEPGGGDSNIGINFFYGCNWWSFHNVRIRAFGSHGLVLTNSNSGSALNLISEYNGGDGIHVDGEPVNHIGSHGSGFLGCKLRNNLGFGFGTWDSVNVTLDGSTIIEGNRSGGAMIGSGSIAAQVHNCYFENNFIADIIVNKDEPGGSGLPVLGTSIRGNYHNSDAISLLIGNGSTGTTIDCESWPFTGGSRVLHMTTGTATSGNLVFPANYQSYWSDYSILIPGAGVAGADYIGFVVGWTSLSAIQVSPVLDTSVSSVDITISQRPIVIATGAANTMISSNLTEKLSYVEDNGTGTTIVSTDSRAYNIAAAKLFVTSAYQDYPTDVLDMAEIHAYSSEPFSIRRITAQAGDNWVQMYAREDSGVALQWLQGTPFSIGPASNIASADSYPKIAFDETNPGQILITTQDPDGGAFLQVTFQNAPNQGTEDMIRIVQAGVIRARVDSTGAWLSELGWTAGDGTSGTCRLVSGGGSNAGYIEWNTAGGTPHRIAYMGHNTDGHLHLNLGTSCNYIIRAQNSTGTPTCVKVDASDAQSTGHLMEFRDASGVVLTYIDFAGNFSGSASAGVTSVNTRTGAVVLTSTDVGLANVTNNAQLKIASNLSDVASASTSRTNLSAAASGANSDITSMTALTTISFGATPASSGTLRFTNAGTINMRNFANTGDLGIMDTTSANILRFGFSGVASITLGAATNVSGRVTNTTSDGDSGFAHVATTTGQMGFKIVRTDATWGQTTYLYLPGSSLEFRIFHGGSDRLTISNAGLVTVPGALTVNGAVTLTSALPLAQGGTAATSASSAHVNLQSDTHSVTGTNAAQSFNLTVGGSMAPAGLYRVNMYMVITTGGTGTSVTSQLVFNDGTGSRTVAESLIAPTVNLETHFTTIVRSDGSAHIAFATVFNSISVAPVYSLWVTMERLI